RDLAELLSELAGVGFERLGDLVAAAEGDQRQRSHQAAKAYVTFAIDNAALFQLMFRSERLNFENPRLRDARGRLFGVFADITNGSAGVPTPDPLGVMTAQR